MYLSTVHLQAEFRKIFFGYLGSDCSYSTYNLNFENRNCSMHMEIWERTSQQLTCKLNFEISFLDIWKWLQHLQNEFRKSKLLDGHLSMDHSTVNLQAEFRKFLFGYLEVVVAAANLISKIEIALWRSGKGPLNS